MPRVIWANRWDGHGNEVPREFFWEYLQKDLSVDLQLFEADRLAILEIPHGEILYRFTDQEWRELVIYVEKHFGSKTEWIEGKRQEHNRRLVVTAAIVAVIILTTWLIVRF